MSLRGHYASILAPSVVSADMPHRPTVFDRIIAGTLPASFVYQDERCVAFLDISPVTHGHTLVVPRQSVATLQELDAATRSHLWEVAQRIGQAQQRGLGSLAQHLLINDGKGASQSVPHVHIHVMPRYGKDIVRTVAWIILHVSTLAFPRREDAAKRAKFDATARRIREALQG